MKGGYQLKRQGVFVGVLLLGAGVFFLANNFNIPFINQFYAWPSILLIIGIAFLLQAYIGKENHSFFPGALLFGLGLHFHGLRLYSFWPSHWAMFTMIVGVAFLIRYSHTKKDGLLPGIILLFISVIALMDASLTGMFGSFFCLCWAILASRPYYRWYLLSIY